MRSEVAHLQFGFNVRHVLDAGSPLAHLSRRQLAHQDACLTLTVVSRAAPVPRARTAPVAHGWPAFPPASFPVTLH